MATVTATKSGEVFASPNGGASRRIDLVWETLTTTNRDGSTFDLPGNARNVAIFAKGTFGASASIALEGTWDGGTTYAALDDTAGTAIALTAASSAAAGHFAPTMRPYLSNGDGSTDVDVYVSYWLVD